MKKFLNPSKNLEDKNIKNIFIVIGIIILITTLAFLIMDAIVKLPNEIEKTFSGTYVSFKHILKGFSLITYFTNQSNIILALAFLVLGIWPNKRVARNFFFSSIIWISITFVIYWALISWNTSAWSHVAAAFESIFLHLIHPVIGFLALIVFRREFIVSQQLYLKLSLYIFGYFFALLILYFSTYKLYTYPEGKHYPSGQTIYDGAVVYNFINFKRPFFYNGSNLALIIILDILIFLIAFLIPISVSLFWQIVLKLQVDKSASFKQLFNKFKR
ncbi:Uncharacterised protein [Mesomycoplasma conjunctivae]|uniref:Uncharacterized protein n=1 Tax=Mesomycoplasma conjunctivae (strain ATCC 25834 / NCTC 10147 / HRC/581) TaxID=572263 RepID=C5J716_MESCH|nr:hypothetical protein [Mesomycoplasma conjunctivae]CAT05279.1 HYPOTHETICAL PROTEIN MCJ_005820 [Mesomycoplasma conjunctivae]VEU66509.1 Uncharacterised protein [Mesomycoplasma conjunctivae]